MIFAGLKVCYKVGVWPYQATRMRLQEPKSNFCNENNTLDVNVTELAFQD